MVLASTTLTVFAIAVLVLGVVAAAGAAALLTRFVVTNRRVRVARHESLRTYYRALALSH